MLVFIEHVKNTVTGSNGDKHSTVYIFENAC